MRRSYLTWYVVIGLLALVPFGLRALTWGSKSARTQPVDMAMAQAGEELFKHVWTVKDPLANGGDGLGPVYNAASCVECHSQGGVGGSGDLKHNVTTFTVRLAGQKARDGVVHSNAISPMYRETLAHVSPGLDPNTGPITLDMTVVLPGQANHCVALPRPVQLSQRNTPALFGAKLIDELPERDIIALERAERIKWGGVPTGTEDAPVGRAARLPNGHIGRFGWKGQTASLSDFVQAACAEQLGLGNPGQAQPRPLGKPDYQSPGYDLTLEQCDQLTSYVGSLPRPEERIPSESTSREQTDGGKKLFHRVGCADCHTPDVGSVEGIYSDLLLHRMGQTLEGSGSYNDPNLPDPNNPSDPKPDEWRTPPLWGVADSAPYLHDGRARTLDDAIKLHGGQGKASAQRYNALSAAEQAQVVLFLKTLRAPATAAK